MTKLKTDTATILKYAQHIRLLRDLLDRAVDEMPMITARHRKNKRPGPWTCHDCGAKTDTGVVRKIRHKPPCYLADVQAVLKSVKDV